MVVDPETLEQLPDDDHPSMPSANGVELPRSNGHARHAPPAADAGRIEALAWLKQQLDWEDQLSRLRSRATEPHRL